MRLCAGQLAGIRIPCAVELNYKRGQCRPSLRDHNQFVRLFSSRYIQIKVVMVTLVVRRTYLRCRSLELILQVVDSRLNADQDLRKTLVLLARSLQLCHAARQKLLVIIHHLRNRSEDRGTMWTQFQCALSNSSIVAPGRIRSGTFVAFSSRRGA